MTYGQPEFPLHIKFDDGSEWMLETVEEIEANLEWFDTDDGDTSVVIVDKHNRPVRLRVEKFKVLIFELLDNDVASQNKVYRKYQQSV